MDDEEETGEELVEIEDEEVALVAAAADKIWWSWIPVIGAVASIAEGYRKNRKDKKGLGDGKKKE